MAGGKETPRQKMIGMMYLVLTAMLALNVSKEIINAFVTQDNQMLVNNNNLVEGINGFMTKFSNLELDINSKKSFLKWKPKVMEVNKLANELDDYLLGNLNKMMEESEQKADWFAKASETQYTTWQPIESITKKEDYDIATRLFGGEKSSEGYKKGGEIREKLLELRDSLLLTMGNYSQRKNQFMLKPEWLQDNKILEQELTKVEHPDKLKLVSIYNTLSQPETLENHDQQQAWQLVKFDHQPIVGAIGVFTEMRNQVRMAQQKALELVASKVEEPIMKINKIEPQLIAKKSYLNQGESMDVQVGIIAYDSTATYPIKYKIGGREVSSMNNNFTLKASSVGQQSVNGSLVLDLADGPREFPWSFDYTVGKPMGTIASPEYNVLYAGYDNIIEASISGYSSTDVKVECAGCSSFVKKGSQYIAKVNGGTKTVEIKAIAKGSVTVRKYNVYGKPKPELSFVGKEFGAAPLALIKQGKKLVIRSPKSSPLKIQYQIVSYDLEVMVNNKNLGTKMSSANLSSKGRGMLNNLKRGSKIYISNVKYKELGSSKVKPIHGIILKAI
ncbi:MAG: GldM family protein [Flavobacteriales bacterium]